MTQELANKLNADAYLSKKEAAEYLGYSKKTIDRFVRVGLRHYVMTGMPRFKKADLDDFAQQFRRGAA